MRLFMQLVRFLFASYALTGFLVAQPSLRITSPADGTTVHPGESLTVTVDVSPPARTFQFVMIGTDIHAPDNGKQGRTAPPYEFTVDIPKGIRPDKYVINALGMTFSKEQIFAHPIEILVERADSPVSISVYPVVADFTMDQKRYFSVTGVYADKTEADLSQSSRIRYVSNAPGVATVDSQGIVKPVAPGSGKITITYDNLKLEVPLTVR